MKKHSSETSLTAKEDGKTDGKAPAKLNRDIQAKLGDQLRQMYNDVVGQGVPDRFADLLAKLDEPAADDGEKSPQ